MSSSNQVTLLSPLESRDSPFISRHRNLMPLLAHCSLERHFKLIWAVVKLAFPRLPLTAGTRRRTVLSTRRGKLVMSPLSEMAGGDAFDEAAVPEQPQIDIMGDLLQCEHSVQVHEEPELLLEIGPAVCLLLRRRHIRRGAAVYNGAEVAIHETEVITGDSQCLRPSAGGRMSSSESRCPGIGRRASESGAREQYRAVALKDYQ